MGWKQGNTLSQEHKEKIGNAQRGEPIIALAFLLAIVAGFVTIAAFEVGWQVAYSQELTVRGGTDPMEDWSTGVWDRPLSAGPGYSLYHLTGDGQLIRVPTRSPPYPEPLPIPRGEPW